MQDPAFVKRAFAGIAPRYVCTNHVLSFGMDILWRRKLARCVAEASPQTLLDLATGSGDVLAELRRIGPGIFAAGVDFCPEMLEYARRRALPNLIVADAMRLPFASGAFDILTVAFGLRNMESWPDALREMRRVLGPGGRLYILDFSLPSPVFLRTPYRFYLRHILPYIGGVLTGKRKAYTYLADSIDSFPSGQAMIELIHGCGFRSARAIPLSLGVASLYIAEASSCTPSPASSGSSSAASHTEHVRCR